IFITQGCSSLRTQFIEQAAGNSVASAKAFDALSTSTAPLTLKAPGWETVVVFAFRCVTLSPIPDDFIDSELKRKICTRAYNDMVDRLNAKK
ncbi:MAG TPA: hypothetical protein VIT23_00545, partial [Terrimicrobiaceae bacterium]